jgi:hypothetical protein
MLKSKFVTGLAIAALAATAFMGVAAAQVTDTASGGNGGVSTANANGGGVSIGSTNSGGTTGIQAILDDALVSGDDIAARVIAEILGHE